MADEIDTGAERTLTPPPADRSTAEGQSRSAARQDAEAENTVAPATDRVPERVSEASASAPDEPQPAQRRGSAEKDRAANDDQPPYFSVQRGDVPDAVKRRYYSEEPSFAPELRFYTDATGKSPAFRDTGDRLVARETSPEVIKDIVAIARHRGWRAIEVRGQDDFRREVWLEARTAGLQVRGYKPAERDLQELERRLAGRDANAVAPARHRGPTQETDPADARAAANDPRRQATPARLDYDKGVVGRLVESGVLPYKHRAGQELTPFVRVEQADGRQVEVWGVGLPAALERSGAKVGDEITLRRDGVEIVSRTIEVKDKRTGEISLQKRDVPRNRWTIEAERFRASTPSEAARDPALRDAQSRLAVVSAVVKDREADPAARDRLIAGAKEKIASYIEQGAAFAPARIREPEVAKERPAAERAPAAERDRAAPPELNKAGPERTRGR